MRSKLLVRAIWGRRYWSIVTGWALGKHIGLLVLMVVAATICVCTNISGSIIAWSCCFRNHHHVLIHITAAVRWRQVIRLRLLLARLCVHALGVLMLQDLYSLTRVLASLYLGGYYATTPKYLGLRWGTQLLALSSRIRDARLLLRVYVTPSLLWLNQHCRLSVDLLQRLGFHISSIVSAVIRDPTSTIAVPHQNNLLALASSRSLRPLWHLNAPKASTALLKARHLNHHLLISATWPAHYTVLR